jgi:hypothetical protein
MVAVIEQKNSPMEKHHRFIPLTDDNNIYNCELCGVRIAVLKIVSSSNAADDQEQFKVCGTCLKNTLTKKQQKKSSIYHQ